MIEIARAANPELLEALNRLIPQLSSSAEALTAEALEAIVDSPSCTLFIARHEGHIVGTLTLVCFAIPTGTRAWIEDVVVDDAARGAGIGDALVAAALDHARLSRTRNVDLTSRSSRVAAHRLYEHAGFQIRETSVYRFSFES